MFVLPRRTLQSMIFELDGSLSHDQLAQLVGRLNRPGADRLAAMWELIVMWALSGVGSLQYEVALPNGRRPDVTFGKGEVAFVADISTVSDAGLDKRNDFRAVWKEIARIARKAGLEPNHFGARVDGGLVGDFPNQKMVLSLPAPQERAAFLRKHVVPFVERAKLEGVPVQAAVDDGGVKIQLFYDPKQWSSHFGYPSYEVIQSIERNPIANRLQEKAKQVRGAPPPILRGLILCDGGCAAMSKTGSGFGYSRREIVRHFLRDDPSIDFVVLLAVVAENGGFGPRMHLPSDDFIMENQGERFSVERRTALFEVIEQALRRIPPYELNGKNASIGCEAKESPDMIGGSWWSDRRVKISARAIMRLLAGAISLEEFRKAYHWTPESERYLGDPFTKALEEGRLIKSVSVEPDERHDDDWLDIKFSDPDPAVAPFRAIR